ncbi:carboxymuconolactone decarboxylase family protein [Streptomyces stelliscabiei]|uniref:Alkylhydroperoxidase family enzyme n=1 Tax=Streptomyces stelliscabiei TaxID=146820 RepID=A0A8I0PJM1_9ACTN|nr:carboxymuconolactone decarboxylase family protein [Streptomyces stelliscabiei]MBE1602673.1 alkylhydroperoxidase family enzyme [Streptomyces stelliscabiei]MDX2516881.1 carboxymuconolactone decarboxylase family protein [Streptomyces stelliscabiei]
MSEPPMPPAAPRIPPQPADEWDESVRETLSADIGSLGLGVSSLGEAHVFTTLARHPKLFAAWLPFSSQLLLAGELPFADRELVILRVARNCDSPYEWGQHVRIAAKAGLSSEDMARVAVGPDAPGWTERQSLLLRATDELHSDARIGQSTWAGLTRHLTEQQLIELPMLVGHYHLLAFTLNSLRVLPEPGLPPMS